MNKNRWLNLDLTLEQTLELEVIKRDISNIDRASLEDLCLDVLKLKMMYQNAFKSTL